jgi:hypothetical protein
MMRKPTEISEKMITRLLNDVEQMIYDGCEEVLNYNELGEDGLYSEVDRVRAIIGKALVVGGGQ